MKTEIIEKECENKSIYPCLMQGDSILVSKLFRLVVLFVEDKMGTVIIGNEFYQSGYFNNDWRMECFNKFEGKLILEND